MGVEKNILTLCPDCHREFDNGSGRNEKEIYLQRYLESKYPDWNREDVIFDKWKGVFG